MKKTVLIALLLMSWHHSFSQKIHFCDTTNKWRWFAYSCGGDPWYVVENTDTLLNDTMIHGNLYRTLRGAGCGVREDTSAGKVYAILPPQYPDFDSSERLLYDYNLHAGDSFKTKHTIHVVASTGSVLLNSIPHKTWHLHGVFGDSTIHVSVADYDVIEGMGSLNEPLYPLNPFFFETCVTLTCFENHGSRPVLDHKVGYYFDNDSSCTFTFGLGINHIQTSKVTPRVIPNPVNQSSKIVFPEKIISGTVIVVNNVGQSVINITFNNKEEILIGDSIHNHGIYYYRIINIETGVVYSGKFVD